MSYRAGMAAARTPFRSRRSHRSLRAAVCAAALTGALLTAGCTSPTASEDAKPGGEKASTGVSALEAVDELTVKGRSPKTGYSREQFGRGWVDTDGNGCGTRDDILKRDLSEETFRGGGDGAGGGEGCQVVKGVLDDPYTGRSITFARGGRSEVDIDHVVALSDAWQKGAQKWAKDKRVEFANDPLNLLAAEASANRTKGDADAATWLPPDRSFRCAYVARQVAVKKKYGVRVTEAEKDAMVRVLEGCPEEKLPDAGAPAPGGPGGPGGPGESDVPEEPDEGDGGAVTYANCDAVRAAGKAPIHRDDPGYGKHLDRDGDGTGCDT